MGRNHQNGKQERKDRAYTRMMQLSVDCLDEAMRRNNVPQQSILHTLLSSRIERLEKHTCERWKPEQHNNMEATAEYKDCDRRCKSVVKIYQNR